MKPDIVVMLHPLPNDDLGLFKTVEDLPIQKVISKGAVKAFTKTIFPRAYRPKGSRLLNSELFRVAIRIKMILAELIEPE
jgi:hypothetical protein